jgi:uncharacterized protein (TIGR02646 family)
MRHIKRIGTPPEDWLEKARELTGKLAAAASHEERCLIIDANPKVWGELKEWLLSFSQGKCWFSEARDVFSHQEVEHFRPKKKAKRLDGSAFNQGYWWLTFDWLNFRVCGNVGNRKKGTYFPLRDGCTAACCTNQCIDDEIPYLLDPCDPDDPDLLSFDMDGRALPSDHCGDWDTLRVTETIERLRLDFPPLEEERRRIWERCERLINECENLAVKFHEQPSATKRSRIKGIRDELREMVDAASPLSSVAIACLANSDTSTARKLSRLS